MMQRKCRSGYVFESDGIRQCVTLTVAADLDLDLDLDLSASAIPALFESESPVGPYRRLLNSVLVVDRLCIIAVAVAVSPRRLVASPPRRLAVSPRRLAASPPPRRLVAAVPDRHHSHPPFAQRGLGVRQLCDGRHVAAAALWRSANVAPCSRISAFSWSPFAMNSALVLLSPSTTSRGA
jgi:hypothetical protein